jgi:hypothetical protein
VHLGFTAIHPYADGNGRMARLLANVPTLRAGQPPLLILSSQRRTYLGLMGDYSLRRGRPRPAQPSRSSAPAASARRWSISSSTNGGEA